MINYHLIPLKPMLISTFLTKLLNNFDTSQSLINNFPILNQKKAKLIRDKGKDTESLMIFKYF